MKAAARIDADDVGDNSGCSHEQPERKQKHEEARGDVIKEKKAAMGSRTMEEESKS